MAQRPQEIKRTEAISPVMNDNDDRCAISTSKARHAEIDGERRACEFRLRNLSEALYHLDASLVLLDHTYDPALVRPKRPCRWAKLFGGRKLIGLILDAPRRAERPLTMQEVVLATAAEMNGGGAAPNVTKRIRIGSQYLARLGSIEKEGEQTTALWRLR
jgi:hypothetical protein